MSRYTNKPFLKLLECYILNSIDQLDDAQRETLVKMEPKLASIYGINGSWLDVVTMQMDFPESLTEQIREIWSKYLDNAKAQGVSIDPTKFAMSFVDQNFPNCC